MLTLNGVAFSLDDLVDSHLEALAPTSSYEFHTLRFCQQWLRGKQSFTVETSGSTGKPKQILLKRPHMVASARLTGKTLGLQKGDAALVCLSTQHVAGIMMLVRGFELGLSLTVITPCRNPLKHFDDATGFDFTAMVPLQLQEILMATPEKLTILNDMRVILLGGAPINEDLSKKITTIKAPVYHTYGMTETLSHIALRRLNGPQTSDCFKPLEGVELGVNDNGCLMVKSPTTDDRYVFSTDRVELQEDNSFRWLGRMDNVINTGGFKVQAEKVEAVLDKVFYDYQHGLLAKRRFFVGPLLHPSYGQTVAAIIEGEPFSGFVQEDIKAKLRFSTSLKPHEIPKFFRFLPCFLETTTNKIDRIANLKKIA